jgi:hypothetical protein
VVDLDLDDAMNSNHIVDLEPYEWLIWLPAPALPAAPASAPAPAAVGAAAGAGTGGGSERGGRQTYEPFVWFKVNNVV